jgi:septal ring factor EnvC (AmiA/AmiB activator)
MPRPSTGTNLSLAALQSIMESRRTELGKLRKQRNDIQRKLDGIDRQIDRIEGGGSGRTGSGRARNAKSLTETLEEVLSSGKPMKVGDIVDAVKASGYRSSSANFRGIVNQTLIKENKRFTAPSRGLYQVKK